MPKDLKNLLKSNDTEVRRRAIETLRENRDASQIPLLLEGMKDESWRVRKTATEILQMQYTLEEYIGGVISLLYIDDDAGARNSAIDLLVVLGKAAIPYLIDAFQTDNGDVRKFIIDVIGEISDKRALPLLLNALKDEDENVKASAVEHLGKLREPTVVDALLQILQGDDLWTAYPAADALGRIGDRKAIPFLVRALDNKTLREPSLRALASFADTSTLDAIVPLLISGSRSVKEEALRTINDFYKKGIGETAIAEKLKEHLGDDTLDVVLQFAWSTKKDIRLIGILLLGLLKDSEAVQPLLDMSSEEEFQDEIKRALVFIGREIPDYIIGLFSNLHAGKKRFIMEVAVETGKSEFCDLFKEFLGDEDGHVRALAVRGISGIGDGSLVELILPLLDDEYQDVQEAAIDALVRLSDGVDRERLKEGLSSESANVRRNSAIILGRMDSVESVAAIGFLIKDSNVSVRKSAVKALALIQDPDIVKHIMIALTDEVPDIRVTAAYALGLSRAKEAVAPLVLLLADPDESVRVAAAKALSLKGDPDTVGPLITALSDSNGFVVTAAIETLGAIGTDEAKDAIVSMLPSEDEEIKRTAISALIHFEGINDVILPFLRDPDWATRKTAVEVLGRSGGRDVVKALETVYDDEADPIVRGAIKEVLNVR